MNLRRLLAIALLAAGTLILIYRGVTYTSKKHTASLGSIDFSIKEKKRFEIPIWAGVVAIVLGTGLLVLPRKKG